MIKSFRDWKVRNKLLAVFGIIMLMLLVVSGYIFVSTKSMITQIRKIEMGEFERVSLSTEMRAIVLKLEALFLSASSENYSRVFREVESKKDKFFIHTSDFRLMDDKDLEVNYQLEHLEEMVLKYYEHGLEIIELIAEKDDVAARRKIEELVYQESEEIQEMLYEFQDEEVANLSMGVGQIDTMARNLRKACLTLLIATLLIVIIFIVKSTKMISSSMKLLIKGTHEISKGHFGYKALINSKDEFGEMLGEFNAMSAKLQEIAASKYLLEKEIKERMVMEHKLTEYTHEVEAVNKELESFTYIISHDLKEPLRSIDAFSKFIMDDYLDKLDEQGIYYLNRVRANAKKMQELIEDLLEVSRLEQKRNPFSDSAVNDIIDEVKLRLECSIKEKNVEIVIKDALPIIFCDKVRLTEVFANIMSNAIKFMDKKDPLVEIGYSEAKTHHRFYIKDNGIGIEEKYYDKIFDIFQRLNVKEKYEGTGAGLAIVKKIIQMHHGKVWVDSTFGEGSTFHFSILKDKDAILERRKLGEILIDKELVSSEDVQKALVEQRRGSVLEGGEEIS